MKLCLLIAMLTLITLSSAEFHIECYGEDHLMVNNLLLQCTSKVQQACYTKANQEKGCIPLAKCSKPGWNCCYTDRCNA